MVKGVKNNAGSSATIIDTLEQAPAVLHSISLSLAIVDPRWRR
jgi:hypothetical protein